MPIKSVFFLFVIVICVVLLVSYAFTGDIKFWKAITLGAKPGTLTIQGQAPQVLNIFINNSPTSFSTCGNPYDGNNYPVATPTADGYAGLQFRATVYDINTDHNATVFYICANETLPANCNQNNAFATLSSTSPTKYNDGIYGPCVNCYANYTVTWNSGLPYYKKCGSWYVNATANDSQNLNNSAVKWWKDNMKMAVIYPWQGLGQEGNQINLGTVSAGAWNNGTGSMGGNDEIKNAGNVNLTIVEWNATNFTGGTGGDIGIVTCTSPCTGGYESTFAVDYSSAIPSNASSGWMNVTPTLRTTYPSFGVYRCENFACASPQNYSNYPLLWHIYIPGGRAGTFTNSIELNTSTVMTC